VTASPLPITAFFLARTLPLVLQVKQLQQLHAIAPAHQPREGGLGNVPLLLVPPPISGSGAGGLDRWWDQGLTLGAREAANNRRPWKWEVNGHGGVFIMVGTMSCPLLEKTVRFEIYVALRTFWYNKKSWGNYPPHAGNYPPKGENQSIWKL
jgi:hypothetical protein